MGTPKIFSSVNEQSEDDSHDLRFQHNGILA
jgi:hypothetical protein